MPMYDYGCSNCLKIYEILVKLDKIDEEIKCPICGKPLKKLLSSPRRINIH